MMLFICCDVILHIDVSTIRNRLQRYKKNPTFANIVGLFFKKNAFLHLKTLRGVVGLDGFGLLTGKTVHLNRGQVIVLSFYPITTSRTIISTKPSAKPMVERLECVPLEASGMSSSTTTYIIAPAAKANR